MIAGHNDHFPLIAETCYIAPSADVIGEVQLDQGASVWFHATLRADVNSITIAEQTNIQDNCVLHVTKTRALVVGKRCTIGHGAILHACTIEDDCLIGMGSIVLDGSHIGKQCLVGAGSVVPPNKQYPDGSLILGSPARVIRKLSEEELVQIRENTQDYWQFAQDLCLGKQTIH
ncbi:gamma carbonic anhydrase family protein [Sphaerochaeta globosa]|jgi:carbonic anhydrase/acetyltransferase-like protein (isoleucine patch superfamily)|uniref:Ferripyochelin binding protein (Fbp) n=1 Tax=Sphaerochaeta globosa (strain ATCC BAA-1886 / DSM 22777 / Buddy) TaxID=158189 RepID=F0RRX1_SPHGB|nr:gamma carbonic anhydrase family protein [Sphaerochaeta globosa]ADY14576.1 ferripyochelin binding protein (fbp) [Sphaerochaeta globosa str. Buddy]